MKASNGVDELKSVVVTGWASIAPAHPALTLDDFKLEDHLESQKTYLDRCSALALAGTADALRHSGYTWPIQEDLAHRFGIVFGTHWGCVETMKSFWDKAVEKDMRHANPVLFSHSYFNSPISLCAIEYGLKGYHTTVCAGKMSGLEAVRTAYEAIRLAHAEAMLCGGVEAVTPTRKLLEENEEIREASVFFVIEEAERAGRRGAKYTVELTDTVFDTTLLHDIYNSITNCGGAESALWMQAALHYKLTGELKHCK